MMKWNFEYTTASLVATLCIFASTAFAQGKNYTFFVGTDIGAFYKEDSYSVTGYADETLFLETGADPMPLPLRKADGLITKRNPKVSPDVAELNELQVDQTYSPGNDPKLAWQSVANAMQEQARQHEDQVRADVIARTQAAAISGANASESFQEGISEIEAAIEHTSRIDDFASEASLQDFEGSFDAIDIRLQITSPTALSQPYLVALVEFIDPKKGAPQVRPLFKTVDLEPGKPQQVRIFEAGFPKDFQIVDTKIALFDSGRELATNRSEKRVEVTLEQALTYLRFSRKSENSIGYVPAAPIPGFTPQGFADSLDSKQLAESLKVEIDATGQVTSLKVADYPQRQIAPDIDMLIREIPFYPALQDGSAIASEIVVPLGQLLR